MFPNTLTPLVVQSTLGFATAVLEIAGLGFLGLGVQPPGAEWGTMVSDGFRASILSVPDPAPSVHSGSGTRSGFQRKLEARVAAAAAAAPMATPQNALVALSLGTIPTAV